MTTIPSSPRIAKAIGVKNPAILWDRIAAGFAVRYVGIFEVVRNSIDAIEARQANQRSWHGGQIYIGPDPSAAREGKLLLCIIDNGTGIPLDRLEELLGDATSSGRDDLGESDGHFGSGLKLATAPSSRKGLLIETVHDGMAAQLLIATDAVTKTPGLVSLGDGDQIHNPIPVRDVKSPFSLARGGTKVTFYGDEDHREDTLYWLDDEDWAKSQALIANEISSRFLHIPSDIDLYTVGPDNKKTQIQGWADLLDEKTSAEKDGLHGFVQVDGAKIYYWMLSPEEAARNQPRVNGHIGVAFNGEVYDDQSGSKVSGLFVDAGVQALRSRVSMVVVPDPKTVEPDLTRTHLTYHGDGGANRDLPTERWLNQFKEKMPTQAPGLYEAVQLAQRPKYEIDADKVMRKFLEHLDPDLLALAASVEAAKREGVEPDGEGSLFDNDPPLERNGNGSNGRGKGKGSKKPGRLSAGDPNLEIVKKYIPTFEWVEYTGSKVNEACLFDARSNHVILDPNFGPWANLVERTLVAAGLHDSPAARARVVGHVQEEATVQMQGLITRANLMRAADQYNQEDYQVATDDVGLSNAVSATRQIEWSLGVSASRMLSGLG